MPITYMLLFPMYCFFNLVFQIICHGHISTSVPVVLNPFKGF